MRWREDAVKFEEGPRMCVAEVTREADYFSRGRWKLLSMQGNDWNAFGMRVGVGIGR